MRHFTGIALAAACAVVALARPAAAENFVDAPLTLKPLHLSADVGLGFGTYQAVTGTTPATTSGSGWGSTLEAALGLPFVGELGARLGYNFNTDGVLAQGDHYARLFDPIVTEPATQQTGNPEFHLRGTLVPLEVFELGLETRLVVPTSSTAFLAITPGVPIRVHLPGMLRVDTGAWLPVQINATTCGPGTSTCYALDVPAQAFFQIGDAFVGPLTGLRFNNIGGSPTSTDVPLGAGGGYTLGGVIDVKLQVRTEAINDPSWSKRLGGGLGVGLRFP